MAPIIELLESENSLLRSENLQLKKDLAENSRIASRYKSMSEWQNKELHELKHDQTEAPMPPVRIPQ